MSDIFREVDEDLRRDRLSQAAKRYGGIVIAVAVLVVGATAAYTGWQAWQRSERQQATATLADALVQADAAPQRSAEALAAFAAAGAPDDLDTLARLSEAGLLVRQGRAGDAVGIYDAIAANAEAAAIYRDLATLLSVMNQVASGEPGALRARIEPLTAETSPWRFTARELSGLLAARAGDRGAARTLFQQLADDALAPAGVRARAADLAALYGKT